MNPSDRKYTKEHGWVKVESEGKARIGITAYAVAELGEVVYFELPVAGEELIESQKFGEVESIKAVSDLFAPIGGQVLEVNSDLSRQPEIVNEDPWEKGWLLMVLMHGDGGLTRTLTSQEYTELTCP